MTNGSTDSIFSRRKKMSNKGIALKVVELSEKIIRNNPDLSLKGLKEQLQSLGYDLKDKTVIQLFYRAKDLISQSTYSK